MENRWNSVMIYHDVSLVIRTECAIDLIQTKCYTKETRDSEKYEIVRANVHIQ